MAWSTSDLAALETAIKGGTKRVRYSDRYEVEYHSLAEMLLLRDQMKAEIDEAAGTGSSAIFAGRIP